MPGTWSINTTIRNPERNVPFLTALSRFEGRVFDEEVQASFFKELIKTKAYKPTGLPSRFVDAFDDPEEFSDEEVLKLLTHVQYKNSSLDNNQEKIYALRGRTAVGNLNKMGLAVARETMGPVVITDLGRDVMAGRADMPNVFLHYFLKWQLPNMAENGFSNFDIIPFIAVMHVIDRVNQRWSALGQEAVGVSKEEFSLFLTTLSHFADIDNTVNDIIEFRQAMRNLGRDESFEYIKDKFEEMAIAVFDLDPHDERAIAKKVNNLHDYGDSAIRYFRQTQLLYYRGNGRYVDLAPTRIVEIRSILDVFDGSSFEFDNAENYFNYVADINQPELPWENQNDLRLVYLNLRETAIGLQEEIRTQYDNQALHYFELPELNLTTIAEYNREIANLRDIIRTLSIDRSIMQERSLENIDDYADRLMGLANRGRRTSGQDPLNLEWFFALSLMALDDARAILPNYSVGDDGIPIFTASGNKPDVEAYYDSFNLTGEVTLLRSRDQWFNEGQPVMRHLRDFESRENNLNSENYCLFIAPNIHRDTLNTFWGAINWGFEGNIQKIVPLTIEQYIRILRFARELNAFGARIRHIDIKLLLDMIIDSKANANGNSLDWCANIDTVIDDWCGLISNDVADRG